MFLMRMKLIVMFEILNQQKVWRIKVKSDLDGISLKDFPLQNNNDGINFDFLLL